MLIPNADKAIIAPEKLRDYLLNPAHRRGSAKGAATAQLRIPGRCVANARS